MENDQHPNKLSQLFDLLEQMEFRSGNLKLEKSPVYLLLKEYCSTHCNDMIPEDYFSRYGFHAYLQKDLRFQNRDLDEPEDDAGTM